MKTLYNTPEPNDGSIGRDAEASKSAFAFHDPSEVVKRTQLSHTEKREILASWASDARAPQDAPTLRQIDCGALIKLTDISDALRALDRLEHPAEDTTQSPSVQLSRFIGKLIGPPDNDDNDDPPPCPVAAMPRPKTSPLHFVAKPLPLERKMPLLECA